MFVIELKHLELKNVTMKSHLPLFVLLLGVTLSSFAQNDKMDRTILPIQPPAHEAVTVMDA